MSETQNLHPNGRFEGDEQAYDWVQELPDRKAPKVEVKADHAFDTLVSTLENNLTQVKSFAFKFDDLRMYLKSAAYRYDRVQLISCNDTPVFVITKPSTDETTFWTGNPEKAGLTPVEDEGYF